MATNRRPTTSINVTYGTIGTLTQQRALNPVLIAPRYRLHSYASGYEDALLLDSAGGSSYEVGTTGVTTMSSVDWPARDTDSLSVIDNAGGELYAHDAFIQLNATAASATVASSAANLLTLPSSRAVTTNGGVTSATTLIPEFSSYGFHVETGDQAIVTSGATTVLATVTGIGATSAAAAVGSATAVNASTTYTGCVAGGTYTGVTSTTYLVKITETPEEDATSVKALFSILGGGDVGYSEEVTVSTTERALGTLGATFKLSSGFDDPTTGVKAGNAWKIICTPVREDSYNKVYINRTLASGSWEVKFQSKRYTAEYVSIPRVNFTASRTSITVNDTINLTINGKVCRLMNCTLYMKYRELLTADALEVVACTATNAATWAGLADVQNPMGMMYAAASAVEDGFFYMLSVKGTTDADYIEAVNYAAQFEDLYAFVTYNQSVSVRNAQIAAITRYADPQVAQFKRAWLTPLAKAESTVYAADDAGNALLGSISSGVLTLASPGDAIANGVAPGDYAVLYISGSEGDSTAVSKSFKITEITAADTMTLEDASNYDLHQVSFKRTLTPSQYAEALAAEAHSLNNYRLNLVWADSINILGVTDADLSYLCAVLATTRSSLPPHAPMSDLPVTGVTINSKHKFTDTQYDVMNTGGVWIVANNSYNEAVNYHQITTKTDGTIAEEDSCVSGGDAIIRIMRTALKPYASGKSNVSDQLLTTLRGVITANAEYIKSIPFADTYGPLLVAFTINQLYRPASNKTAIMLDAELEMSEPLLSGSFTFNLI